MSGPHHSPLWRPGHPAFLPPQLLWVTPSVLQYGEGLLGGPQVLTGVERGPPGAPLSDPDSCVILVLGSLPTN